MEGEQNWLEEEEDDRKYVRGKNHILFEWERGCGCGARS